MTKTRSSWMIDGSVIELSTPVSRVTSQFAPLLRVSPVAISLSSLEDGRIFDVNDAFLRLFGYVRTEVVGRTSTELGMFVDPKDRATAVDAALKNSGAGAVEVTITTRTGSPRRVLLWPEVVDARCLLTQIFDITSSYADEGLWRDDVATAGLLRAVFEAAAEGIVVQDASGRIVMVNPSAERILGLSTIQMSGRTAGDRLWQATREDGLPLAPDEHPTAITLRTGQPQTNVVLSVRIEDQPPVWVSVTTRPVQLPGCAEPNGVVASFFDISDRKHHEARLAHQATRDTLTGLFNREEFLRQIDEALSRGRDVAILFLDLDGFKLVNDTLGHSAGDALLAEVGRRLSTCLRQEDVAARFGGDEFIVLLQNATACQATMIGDRILNALREPFILGNHHRHISGSIGITLGRPGSCQPGGLIQEADVALYRAKAVGKDQIVIFASTIPE